MLFGKRFARNSNGNTFLRFKKKQHLYYKMALNKIRYCVLDGESTFDGRILHSISIKAVEARLRDGTWKAKVLDSREYMISDFFKNDILVKKENVLEKLAKVIKKDSSVDIQFRPFSYVMSEITKFGARYGGVILAHSMDRDLEFMVNSDNVFGTMLFTNGDPGVSEKLPHWAGIKWMCTQYLISYTKWAVPYAAVYPHMNNRLQTLVKDIKQDHTASSDVDMLIILTERLCNVSNGQFLEERSNAVFAKPIAGIR